MEYIWSELVYLIKVSKTQQPFKVIKENEELGKV